MKSIKYLFCLLLLCSHTAVYADPFRDGVVAYQQQKYQQALEAWLPLADTGHVLAQTLVGSMYAYGEGVEKNDQEAFKWLSRAAQDGSAQAQYNLAILYEKGFGITANKTLAQKWYKAAAAQGRQDAATRYALLEDQPPIAEPQLKLNETTTPITPTKQRIHIILNKNHDNTLFGPVTTIKIAQHGLAWARQQPSENYTIQLASSIEPRLIEAFKNHLKLTQHYAKTITDHKSHQWHALIYGSYASVKEAKVAMDTLPIKWKTWQPWIKRFSSISAIKD